MRSSTEDAAARWNVSTGAPAQFTLVSYWSTQRDLRVTFSLYGATNAFPAWTTLWCGNDHYTRDPRFDWARDFVYPDSTTGWAVETQRTATAVHEIGHTYGLDHNMTPGCDPATAGLMFAPSRIKLDFCSWFNPTSDDVNGASDAHDG